MFDCNSIISLLHTSGISQVSLPPFLVYQLCVNYISYFLNCHNLQSGIWDELYILQSDSKKQKHLKTSFNTETDSFIINFVKMFCSFGITPTMEKLYHHGQMHTISDDCQFVCIAQSDYYKILHQVRSTFIYFPNMLKQFEHLLITLNGERVKTFILSLCGSISQHPEKTYLSNLVTETTYRLTYFHYRGLNLGSIEGSERVNHCANWTTIMR